MKWIGIALIVLGVVAMIYGGITYKRQERIIDLGPIQATTEKKETIPLPPVLGGALFIGGVVLIAVDSRKSTQ